MELGIDRFISATNNSDTSTSERMTAMAQLLERMEQADQ